MLINLAWPKNCYDDDRNTPDWMKSMNKILSRDLSWRHDFVSLTMKISKKRSKMQSVCRKSFNQRKGGGSNILVFPCRWRWWNDIGFLFNKKKKNLVWYHTLYQTNILNKARILSHNKKYLLSRYPDHQNVSWSF